MIASAARIRYQTSLFDTVNAARFVLFSRAAARASGAENFSVRIPDQHAANLWQKLSLRGCGKGNEEVGIVLRPLCKSSARGAHADRGPRLSLGHIEPEHARAVFALCCLHVAAVVQHH